MNIDDDHDCEPSDDERAEEAWARAAATAMTKDFVRFFWPLLVSVCILVPSWLLALAGALALGGWGVTLFTGVVAIALTHLGHAAWVFTHTDTSKLPVLASGGISLRYMLWWTGTALPRAIAAAYALTFIVPMAVAVTCGWVIAGWPLVFNLTMLKRYDRGYWQRWEDLVKARRPAGGLPTPEL